MSFASIYIAANNETFQGRCMAAAWITAQHVIAQDEGYNITTPSRDFAYRLLRDQSSVSPKQMALQILRNVDIAADPDNALDATIDWQIKNCWLDVVAIG
jgi:hypothetical protein